ncbi:MAG: sodium:solute symporter family protein, partial [Longimicrobiales bacterium]|nr:sodium:solute symporter family protein [Longimicrobiales bacterium]
MEPWVVATSLIFIYLLATIVLGVIANRRMTGDMEDFLLYGRKAGFIVLYLTVVATFHSAFAFLGSGGFFYTHGIGFWAAGTWTCLVGAITYVLGPRIWALGKANGYITPADMLADFYESEAVRVAVAIVSVVFTILYIQVQAQGLGYIINIASGDRISFEIGTLILLVVAAAYLMAGGLRAVYWTDVIQGIWMYVAVWVGAMYLAYDLFGGPLQLWAEVRAQRPDLLSLPGPEGFFTPGMWLGMTITLSFGIVFQPHMMIRYYTAVDAKTLKILGATTPIYLMTLYVPAALVGLGGAVAMPGLEVPDRIFPELLFAHAPPILTGVILAGATAAAMSTLDSILHANMSVLTRDVYQRYIAPDREQGHYVWV